MCFKFRAGSFFGVVFALSFFSWVQSHSWAAGSVDAIRLNPALIMSTGSNGAPGSPSPSIPSQETEKEYSNDISGIYYLREVSPQGLTDVGSLLRTPAETEETTFCGCFIVFHFYEEGYYSGPIRIHNIYYHFWQKKPELPMQGDIFDIGYNTNGQHTGQQVESITIDTRDNVCSVGKYRLVQAMQFVDPEKAFFTGQEIRNFLINSTGNGPRILCSPERSSFVILNLEDDAALRTLDRDNDLLDDYSELYVHFTNPFDPDTDDDGASDFEETMAQSFGFEVSNPNDTASTTPFELVASLQADTKFLPQSGGGTVAWELSGGPGNAGRKYILLGSVTGTSPSTPLPGGLVNLPLSWDFFTKYMITQLNTTIFSGFMGNLDSNGEAKAYLNLPRSQGFDGLTLYFAFACSNPYNLVSNPVTIELVD